MPCAKSLSPGMNDAIRTYTTAYAFKFNMANWQHRATGHWLELVPTSRLVGEPEPAYHVSVNYQLSGCQIRIAYDYYGSSHACTLNLSMSLCGMSDLRRENTKWQPHWGFPDLELSTLCLYISRLEGKLKMSFWMVLKCFPWRKIYTLSLTYIAAYSPTGTSN